VIKHGIDPKDAPIIFGEDLVIGKFIDKPDQPTLDDRIAMIAKNSKK